MRASQTVLIAGHSLRCLPPGESMVFHVVGARFEDGPGKNDWSGWATRCGRVAWKGRHVDDHWTFEESMESVRVDIACRIGRPCLVCWPASRRPLKLEGPMTPAELW